MFRIYITVVCNPDEITNIMDPFKNLMKKFENFQREIENLESEEIKIVPDANGMFDRQCPKEDCKSHFKVNVEDWSNIFKDEEVFCPFCRNKSIAKEYLPAEQRNAIIENIRGAILDNWKYGKSISRNLLPVESEKEFELILQCEICNVRYAVIGNAYFCPNCGHNSIERTAKSITEKLILKAEKINLIKDSLEETFTKDESAIIAKSILENAISECIGTLQSYSETIYNNLSTSNAPFNAFQNFDKANRLWIELKGQGYYTWLSENERKALLIYTQRRHLIEHKGGIIDSKYLENTNDKNYSIGERIVIKSSDVIELGNIVLKLIDSINKV